MRSIFGVISFDRPISEQVADKFIQVLVDNLKSNRSYNLFTDGACEFDDDYKPVNAGIGGLLKMEGGL